MPALTEAQLEATKHELMEWLETQPDVVNFIEPEKRKEFAEHMLASIEAQVKERLLINAINNDGLDHEALYPFDGPAIYDPNGDIWVEEMADLIKKRKAQLKPDAFKSWCAGLSLCADHERYAGECVDDPDCSFVIRHANGRIGIGGPFDEATLAAMARKIEESR